MAHPRSLQAFYESHNVTQMPWVEVFLGSTRLEALVVPPSRVRFLNVILDEARSRLRVLRPQLARRRVAVALEANRVERRLLQRERDVQSRRWRLVQRFIGLGSRQRAVFGGVSAAVDSERRQAEQDRRRAWKVDYEQRRKALRLERKRLERKRQLIERFVGPGDDT